MHSLVRAPSLVARRISAVRNLRLASGSAKALLASYPKSGRTWLRFILAQYFMASRKIPAITTQTMFEFAPNFDLDPVRGIPAFIRRSEEGSFPLIPSTHLKFSVTLPRDIPIIFLIRDPRAVLNSDYHHVTRHKKIFSGTMEEFLASRDRGIPHYIGYMNSWESGLSRNPDHIIYYEDLISDTVNEVARLLEFLQEPIDMEALHYAVDNSSFEKMKALEQAEAIPGHLYNRSDANALRMRKGVVDSFRDELTADQQRLIENNCKSYLRTTMLRKLERHDFLNQTNHPPLMCQAVGNLTSPKLPQKPSQNRQRVNLGIQLLCEAMVVIGLAAILIAPAIFAVEAGEWLFRLEWDGHSLEDGLALFGIDRVGPVETPAEQILDVLIAIPLTFMLFLAGISMFFTGIRYGQWGVSGVKFRKQLTVRRAISNSSKPLMGRSRRARGSS